MQEELSYEGVSVGCQQQQLANKAINLHKYNNNHNNNNITGNNNSFDHNNYNKDEHENNKLWMQMIDLHLKRENVEALAPLTLTLRSSVSIVSKLFSMVILVTEPLGGGGCGGALRDCRVICDKGRCKTG